LLNRLLNRKRDHNGTETILRDRDRVKNAPTKALVTAFSAFPGAPSNPTIALARELERRHGRRLARLSIALHIRILPVRFSAVEGALGAALEEVRPDLVLHLGLAARRAALSVELRALNRLGTLRPDAGRAFAASAAIAPGAPFRRVARWPAQRVRAAMDRSAKTRLSIDAGDYVCNQTLFLTLSRSKGPVGFIHVPRPRKGGGRGKPALADMVEAIFAALLIMAGGARRA
jgi:pyroglutamyl-peptidase